jgi:hypothetical protein
MSLIAACPPPLDEHYRQEPDRPDRRLEEGDLHRREVLQRVLDGASRLTNTKYTEVRFLLMENGAERLELARV